MKAKVETKTTGTLDRGEALTRDRRLKRGTGTVPSRQSFQGNLILPDAPACALRSCSATYAYADMCARARRRQLPGPCLGRGRSCCRQAAASGMRRRPRAGSSGPPGAIAGGGGARGGAAVPGVVSRHARCRGGPQAGRAPFQGSAPFPAAFSPRALHLTHWFGLQERLALQRRAEEEAAELVKKQAEAAKAQAIMRRLAHYLAEAVDRASREQI